MAGGAGLAGCACEGTDLGQSTFVCASDADCSGGYFCDRAGVCAVNGDRLDGGGGGNEVDAGPLRLILTSAPQAVGVGSCSTPLTFEVRNDLGAGAVSIQTPVSISASPGGVLDFFSGPGCTTPLPLSLAADSGAGSFSFFAGDAGTFNILLTAPGLEGASQQATSAFRQVSALAFTTAAQTIRAGGCSGAVTLELRDPANAPMTSNVPLTVALGSTPSPGVLFYSDSICTQPVTQLTVPVGASNATFYVARNTGLAYSLTASSGTLSATQPHTVLPVVRAGACVIAGGDAGTLCAVVPPVLMLSDSFLVYQVTSSSDAAGALAVICELNGLSSITCRRGRTELDALIQWQVAEVKGATVQKAQIFCDGGLSVPLATAAPVGSSFVLAASRNDGTIIDESDFNLAHLNAAGTAVDFTFFTTCSSPYEMVAQVVTLPGIGVERAFTDLAAASAKRTLVIPPAPQSGVLLAQWKVPKIGPGICDRALRPELVGTSVNFSRGNGSTNAFCSATALATVLYEKVDFKATASAQQVPIAMGAGTGSTSVTVTAVDRTRTLVFAGGQGSTGQSLGEGTHPGTTNATDFLGDVSVSLTLGGTGYQSTQLNARRGSMLGSSRWSAYVLELLP